MDNYENEFLNKDDIVEVESFEELILVRLFSSTKFGIDADIGISKKVLQVDNKKLVAYIYGSLNESKYANPNNDRTTIPLNISMITTIFFLSNLSLTTPAIGPNIILGKVPKTSDNANVFPEPVVDNI